MDEITLPLPDEDVFDIYKEDAEKLPISPATKRRLARKEYSELDHAVFRRLGFEEIYLKSTSAQISGSQEQVKLWDEVSRILRNPVVRVAIDCGLLCRYTLEDLAQMVPAVLREPITEAGLELYSRYFFDVTQMTKSDWRAYLKICSTLPYVYIRYHAALTKPRREALYLAGLPNKPAFTDFLKTVMATAEYKFEYYSRHNNQMSDGQARAWAKVGFDAGVRYEKFSASDITDFAKSVQTEFEITGEDIPMIQSDMLQQVRPPDVESTKKTDAPMPPKPTPEHENF
jgi:hypothetical protein